MPSVSSALNMKVVCSPKYCYYPLDYKASHPNRLNVRDSNTNKITSDRNRNFTPRHCTQTGSEVPSSSEGDDGKEKGREA